MAQNAAGKRTAISDGLFWGFMGALMAGIMGGSIGFVFARFYGAGWLSGAALGAAVFVVAGVILSRAATSVNLPPPNTLKAPTAPPGGAFQAPSGGKFQAAGVAPSPKADARPEPMPSAEEIGQSAGEAVGKAVYGASAAVTSAAAAAKAAIADMVSPTADPGAPITPAPIAEPATFATPMPISAPAEPAKPATLEAPRGGAADDLKKIKGVGPKLEEMLHGLGFYHFDQIAAWGPSELAWVDSNLEGFNGRATRDDWVGQAVLLASGGETEHSRRVERGEST